MTKGIVSALGRKILGAGNVSIRDMIQTDASINPGNSGGPLLNSAGELIGMNTVIYSPSGASSGVGFAVPVDIIKKIVPEIIQHGPRLPARARRLLRARRVRPAGPHRGRRSHGGAGGHAGLRGGLRGVSRDRFGRTFVNDVITAVDKTPVKSYDDLFTALENYKIGDRVTSDGGANDQTAPCPLHPGPRLRQGSGLNI